MNPLQDISTTVNTIFTSISVILMVTTSQVSTEFLMAGQLGILITTENGTQEIQENLSTSIDSYRLLLLITQPLCRYRSLTDSIVSKSKHGRLMSPQVPFFPAITARQSSSCILILTTTALSMLMTDILEQQQITMTELRMARFTLLTFMRTWDIQTRPHSLQDSSSVRLRHQTAITLTMNPFWQL